LERSSYLSNSDQRPVAQVKLRGWALVFLAPKCGTWKGKHYGSNQERKEQAV
jgi:hypothetical protein